MPRFHRATTKHTLMPPRDKEMSKVSRKDSAETRMREVNIKALLVSVSFDSQTDMACN